MMRLQCRIIAGIDPYQSCSSLRWRAWVKGASLIIARLRTAPDHPKTPGNTSGAAGRQGGSPIRRLHACHAIRVRSKTLFRAIALFSDLENCERSHCSALPCDPNRRRECRGRWAEPCRKGIMSLLRRSTGAQTWSSHDCDPA